MKIKKLTKKLIIVLMISVSLCLPVMAKEKESDTDTEVRAEAKADLNTKSSKEISDDKVPLGLESQAVYERYKRDVVVMVIFGTLIVATTIGATLKEKYE